MTWIKYSFSNILFKNLIFLTFVQQGKGIVAISIQGVGKGPE